MPADVDWDDQVWEAINAAVRAEVRKVRVAQRVFPTTVLSGAPTEVPDDAIKFPDFSIEEGRTKPLVEISQLFSLTAAQVAKEPMLKTAQTLARMAAKAIAVVEDKLLFQGKDVPLGTVTAVGKDSLGTGLLGAASPNDANDADANNVSVPVDVTRRTGQPPIWGDNVFSAVATGISKLTNKAQTPRYALFLPLDAYVDTLVLPSNTVPVTTADRIRPLVDGGIYGTGALPAMLPASGMMPGNPGKGLLAALGGDPTVLYVGREAEAEFVQKVGAKYVFRVVERVQFVARDPRAFVLLNFRQTP